MAKTLIERIESIEDQLKLAKSTKGLERLLKIESSNRKKIKEIEKIIDRKLIKMNTVKLFSDELGDHQLSIIDLTRDIKQITEILNRLIERNKYIELYLKEITKVLTQ